ncbi:MAG: DKNYY domain-containing protein [Bdellovibrionales bacterium]
MGYIILESTVKWNSKNLKIDPNLFKELSEDFAQYDQHIFYKNKAYPEVESSTFQILNKEYVKDSKSVYRVLDSKLKHVKDADAQSFKALNMNYGKDNLKAFFREKRISKVDIKTFRAIHAIFAIDNKHFFHTKSPMKYDISKIDYQDVKVFVLNDSTNEVNCPDFIIKSNKSVALGPPRDKGWYHAGDDVDAPSFSFLDNHNLYQIDKNQVYFFGLPIDSADPLTAKVLPGSNVVQDKNGFWSGLDRLDQPFKALKKSGSNEEEFTTSLEKNLTYSCEDLFCDQNGVWLIKAPYSRDQRSKIFLCKERLHQSIASSKELRKLFLKSLAFTGRVYRHVPLTITNYNELIDNPIDTKDIPDFECHLSGTEVKLKIDGAEVSSGPLSSLLSHCSKFWAKSYERRDDLALSPGFSDYSPTLHFALVKSCQVELMQFASYFYQNNQKDEALKLLHLAFGSALHTLRRSRPNPDLDNLITALSFMDLDLSGLATQVTDAHWDLTKLEGSSSLSTLKKIIDSETLSHSQLPYRFAAILHVYWNVKNSAHVPDLLKEILPKVQERIAIESVGYLKEILLEIIEQYLMKALIDINVLKRKDTYSDLYSRVEPLIRFQLKHRVNCDLNRARLIETLWAQNKNEEAEKLKAELLQDCGDDWMAPPMYQTRIYWQNYRLWLMASKLRVFRRIVLPTLSESEKIKEIEAYEKELHKLYEHFGKLGSL